MAQPFREVADAVWKALFILIIRVGRHRQGEFALRREQTFLIRDVTMLAVGVGAGVLCENAGALPEHWFQAKRATQAWMDVEAVLLLLSG